MLSLAVILCLHSRDSLSLESRNSASQPDGPIAVQLFVVQLCRTLLDKFHSPELPVSSDPRNFSPPELPQSVVGSLTFFGAPAGTCRHVVRWRVRGLAVDVASVLAIHFWRRSSPAHFELATSP